MTTREEKRRERRRLACGIPKGAPKAVKVWSLTKEGREFLEKLYETFPEAFPEFKPRPLKVSAPEEEDEE